MFMRDIYSWGDIYLWNHRGKAIHSLTHVIIETWTLLIVKGDMINIYFGTININYDTQLIRDV